MELTKQDRKHIKERVRKLTMRIDVEKEEYAQLYERTYLEELKSCIDERLQVMDMYREGLKNVYDGKGKEDNQ